MWSRNQPPGQPPDLDFAQSVRQMREDTKARAAIREGTVLRYQMQYEPDGIIYSYAAIFANGYWYTTSRSGGMISHDQMLSKLTSEKVLNAHAATAFDEIISAVVGADSPHRRSRHRPRPSYYAFFNRFRA